MVTVGDLLIFGIEPVGLPVKALKDAVYYDKIKHIPDIGWPANVEKLTELNPDLIITSNPDMQLIANMSKVAPVIMTDEWNPMAGRIRRIGEWFDKQQEAEQFLAKHEAKTTAMWKKLAQDGIMKADETASVFQYMRSRKSLNVYTSSYLPTFIYREDGFKPTPDIQKLIDYPDNRGYAEISAELLPQYAGDRIFIVYVDEEERKLVEGMISEPIWRDLPAVIKGNVYFISGALGITTDPLAREKLIEDLPGILRK